MVDLRLEGNLVFFIKTALLISEFFRRQLAPKDAPLFKDAEFAIAWKTKVTRVARLLR